MSSCFNASVASVRTHCKAAGTSASAVASSASRNPVWRAASLASAEAREKERAWLRLKSNGELDETPPFLDRLYMGEVDALCPIL